MVSQCLSRVAIPQRRCNVFPDEPRFAIYFYGPNLPKLGVVENHQFVHLHAPSHRYYISPSNHIRMEEEKQHKKKMPTATKLPSGSWRCLVTVNGKRVSITADTPSEAQAKAIALRAGLIHIGMKENLRSRYSD